MRTAEGFTRMRTSFDRRIKSVATALAELKRFTGHRFGSGGPRAPSEDTGEVMANLTIAYRHLEDASMRLGKAIQAHDGGVSVYDRTTTVGAADDPESPATYAKLGRELIAILFNHCGERKETEGAVETLNRIIAERDAGNAAGMPSPSAALIGFVAWLTTRQSPVTLGSHHDAATVADLVEEFRKSQGWAPPSDDFTKTLRPYPVDSKDHAPIGG